MLNYYLWREI